MTIYIQGMGTISPQQTWEDDALLTQAFDYRSNHLTAVEPDYTLWIEADTLPHLHRLARLALTSARMALRDASIAQADGVIVASGNGDVAQAASGLISLLEQQEQALPNMSFDAVSQGPAALLATQLHITGYQQCYVHGAFSFERALQDAALCLSENADQHVLVTAAEELTAISHAVHERFGLYRRAVRSTRTLFRDPGKGTVAGEGAASFILSGSRQPKSQASLEFIQTYYKPTLATLQEAVVTALAEVGLRTRDIDLVLLGRSGDPSSDALLDSVMKSTLPHSSIGVYKHLCGEYPVASAFALWLGTRILLEHHVPEVVIYKETSRPVRQVLLFNAYRGTHYSLMLLRPCRGIL